MIIKLKDYERIFQINSAVIESEDGDVAHSCVYYSLFGASILLHHFGIEAKVHCGLAMYHAGDDDQVICFGEAKPEGITSGEQGFHCWISSNGWVLDFMAPNFGSLRKTGYTERPRMFQRKASSGAEHPNKMSKAGDFFLNSDPELAQRILLPIVETAGVRDLANICTEWFQKFPKDIPKSSATIDQNGSIRHLKLNQTTIRSNW